MPSFSVVSLVQWTSFSEKVRVGYRNGSFLQMLPNRDGGCALDACWHSLFYGDDTIAFRKLPEERVTSPPRLV